MATIYLELRPDQAQFLGSAYPAYNKINGTNFPVFWLQYDGTSTETAYWQIEPIQYGSGNLTCTFKWTADTANSGGVHWEVAIAAITPDTDTQDVGTKAFATAAGVSDTHLGTTIRREMVCTATVTSLDSLAVGDSVWVKVSRIPADAGDTMAGDACLINAILSYSDT